MYYFLWVLYIISSIIVLYSNKLSEKYRKIVYLLLLLCLASLIIFRPSTTPDYMSYKDIFDMCNVNNNYGFNLFSRELSTGIEYGYIYLILFFKLVFGENYILFLGIITFLSILLTIEYLLKVINKLFLKENNLTNAFQYRIVALIFFSSYYALNYQAIAIRAGLSFMFCIISFYYIIEKKYLISFMLFILGFSIQRMTLILLPIILVYYFFPCFKNKKKYLQASLFFIIMFIILDKTGIIDQLFILLNFILKSFFKIVSLDDYTNYLANFHFANKLDAKRIWMILTSLYTVVFVSDNENYKKILNIFLSGIVILFLTSNITGSARIYDYFCFFSIPLMVYIWINNDRTYISNITNNIRLLKENIINYRINIIKDVIWIVLLLGYYVISFHVWGII